VIALASPVIDYGEFDERDGEPLDHDVLKDPHQRDLVAHLDANIIAKKRIDKL